jgi:S1-C subfamily serine protease
MAKEATQMSLRPRFSIGFAAAVLSTVVVCTVPAFSQKPRIEEDIPSIARDALKSVVVVETKDELGKPLRQGSGFVVSNDGKVVTNFHVIQGAASVEVRFSNGASYQIQGVLASNSGRDLVILKIQTTSDDFQFLSLADSQRVEVGEQVIAIGSPLGLEATVSPGYISAIREVNGLKLLQTTAPVSPGNSGGALMNLSGKVVGVPSLSLTSVQQNTTVSQNLNFAVPSNYVQELLSAAATKEVVSLETAVGGAGPEVPARSPKEIIASAQSLCVWVVSGSPVLKTEFSGKLLEWGKLKLVSSPDDADLVLKVVQTGELNTTTGAGNQATALLIDRTSGTELWSKTRGGSWAMTGWSNAWVARALAKDFIKFFDSAMRQRRQ